MKRWGKIALKSIGLLLLLLIIGAGIGWWYLSSRFLDFEQKYPDPEGISEVTIDNYTFLDRNGNGALDPYEDDRLTLERRVENLLSLMTLEEKIHLLKGSGLASAMGRVAPGKGIPGAVGTIVPTSRLGIPTVYLSDGPAGLRIEPFREGETRSYYATAFPIGTLMASTWNTELVEEVGAAMGNEALEYGIDVILGPGANIHRHPFCGRNFEYYSEDPVLTGYIGAAMVNGIESNGVGTSVKHFVANNQETNRNNNDVIISERALREIYLKGFELIVRESQPWTIMSSYNKVNGTYTSESPKLLTDILRNDWGFEGLVMSDWFGGNDAATMIAAGNDLLEPGTKRQWDALREAYANGRLAIANIDTAVRRILRLILGSRKMQGYTISNQPNLDGHALVTRNAASEGMVLLKNTDVLPLDPGQRIALLGVTSYEFIAGGTGSGDVNEAYTISLETGLLNAGLDREDGFGGTAFSLNAGAKEKYDYQKAQQPDAFVRPEGINAMFTPYNPPQLTYSEAEMRQIAASSDVAIFTIGRNSGEGGDRRAADDFLITREEREILELAAKVFHEANKAVIVVLNIGGVIETASWKGLPDAILLAWQGGQEGGNSVADILSGKVNPSGKLPMTFPVTLSDHASDANFPQEGKPMGITDMLGAGKQKDSADLIPNEDVTRYEEGIYVGYRHFDTQGLKVSYPFGFGLSYTTFTIDSLQTQTNEDQVIVSLRVTNSGKVSGKEVVQLYISKPDSKIERPIRELKAFAKTRSLDPGTHQIMQFTIAKEDLQYWDEVQGRWIFEPGEYSIAAGVSSRDIRQQHGIKFNSTQ